MQIGSSAILQRRLPVARWRERESTATRPLTQIEVLP